MWWVLVCRVEGLWGSIATRDFLRFTGPSLAPTTRLQGIPIPPNANQIPTPRSLNLESLVPEPEGLKPMPRHCQPPETHTWSAGLLALDSSVSLSLSVFVAALNSLISSFWGVGGSRLTASV